MCVAGSVHGRQCLQELSSDPENSCVLKALGVSLVVVYNHSVDGRSKQLEYQTLMFPVGPLMDEVVEQLNYVMGRYKSLT